MVLEFVFTIFTFVISPEPIFIMLELILKKKIHKKNIIRHGFIKKKKSLKFNEAKLNKINLLIIYIK